MFTGIVESIGTVESVEMAGSNRSFWITSPISNQFSVDQSISHNGVCLTVEQTKGDMHKITAIRETLNKTNLDDWAPGVSINLERSLLVSARLDGHLVQGHVEEVATCLEKQELNGSYQYTFQFNPRFSAYIIEKGSICLNGISLTIFDIGTTQFSVAVIPYTFENTNIHTLKAGSRVNVEFDMIGKYVARIADIYKPKF